MYTIQYTEIFNTTDPITWYNVVDEQQRPLVLEDMLQARTVARIFCQAHNIPKTHIRLVDESTGHYFILPEASNIRK